MSENNPTTCVPAQPGWFACMNVTDKVDGVERVVDFVEFEIVAWAIEYRNEGLESLMCIPHPVSIESSPICQTRMLRRPNGGYVIPNDEDFPTKEDAMEYMTKMIALGWP